MRVLIWHEDQREPGQGGGAESLLRDTVAALKGLGHSVAWLQSGQVEQAVQQFRPDVVHVQTIHNQIPGWQESARWLQDSGIPHLWALMDYWPFCHYRMMLTGGPQPTAWHGCSAVQGVCDGKCPGGRADPSYAEFVNRSPVVALNGYSADIFRRNGIRCDHVVELGVDTGMFAPDPARRNGKPQVFMHSAWPEYPVKGLQVVTAAVRDTALKVQLVAHQPREVVADMLKAASIHIFPSIYEETWGLCLNEAMASGCACIASDVAGPRAQLHDNLGILVPPGDSSALREAMARLLGDSELTAEMGRAARAHVQEEHSLAAMGRRWEAAYHAVTGG